MEEDSPSYLSASALGIRDDDDPTDPDTDVSEICAMLDTLTSASGPSMSSKSVPTGCTTEQRYSKDALVYLAGYLACKCKDIDPGLGAVTPPADAQRGTSRPEHAWTMRLNYGGLTLPSDGWLQLVEQFELQFCLMHGASDIDRQPGVIRRLVEALRDKHPRVDQRIIKKYAVTRTHMRIREIERHRKRLKEFTLKKARQLLREVFYLEA